MTRTNREVYTIVLCGRDTPYLGRKLHRRCTARFVSACKATCMRFARWKYTIVIAGATTDQSIGPLIWQPFSQLADAPATHFEKNAGGPPAGRISPSCTRHAPRHTKQVFAYRTHTIVNKIKPHSATASHGPPIYAISSPLQVAFLRKLTRFSTCPAARCNLKVTIYLLISLAPTAEKLAAP